MTNVEPAGPGQRTTVFLHGARRSPTGEPSSRMPGRQRTSYPDLTPAAMEQLWLAHQMRNQLVQIEYQNEEAIAAIWSTVPVLAELTAFIDKAQAIVNTLVAQVKEQQIARRGKAPDTDLRDALKKARAELKELKVQQRQTKDRVYAEVEPQLVELREQRKAAIKEVRQSFAQAGSYWGTYNQVLDHHNTSVKNLVQKRKKGQPAAHRYHRYRQEGTLAVQLQRSEGDPPRTPQLLASGEGKWRNVVQIKPYVPPDEWAKMTGAERRAIMRTGEVTFRVSGGETVTVPVTLQRMLPPDADITGVQLSRRLRSDRQHTLSVAVTARVPATPLREEGPAVALHMGWRVRDDGAIRVATWVSTEPLEVPEKIQDIVVGNGTWGEIIFPATWRKDFEFVESLRSRRAKMLEDIKVQIVQYLESGGTLAAPGPRLDSDDAEPEALEPGSVKEWRSAGRVTALFNSLRDIVTPNLQDAASVHSREPLVALVSALKIWVRQDKHLWRFEDGRRRRLIGRRIDRYRNAAAWLGKTARVIVLDDIDLSSLARSRSNDDPRTDAARANRVLAAPGDLRRYVENAAVNHGALVRRLSATVSRLTHYMCGTVTVTPEEYADQPVLFCTKCRRGYDQDMNMGRLLLAAAGEAAPVVPVKEN